MSVILNIEEKKPILPRSFCLRACFVKDKKTLVLERLEQAIAAQKEARLEILKAVQMALEMKGESDEIADQVIIAVAESIAIESNSWILNDYVENLN